MKSGFRFLVFSACLFSTSSFASKWYYTCLGRVDTTALQTLLDSVQSSDPQLPKKVGVKNSYFRTNEQRTYVLGQVEKYDYVYSGKDIEEGEAKAIGICTGWSRRQSVCQLATDKKGNRIVCDREKLGSLIATE